MNSNNYFTDKALIYGIGQSRKRKILESLSQLRGKRILDVECAQGQLGRLLRQRGNHVVGWDVSVKAIKQAKLVLDIACIVDLESNRWPETEKYDLIICSEVLEHLFSPEIAVKRLTKYLVPGGKLLITTLNILYYLNRIKFTIGIFRYEKQGMFDESHIHFFSYNTLLNLVNDAGMVILLENHIPSSITPPFLQNLWPSMFAYQFLVLCAKK